MRHPRATHPVTARHLLLLMAGVVSGRVGYVSTGVVRILTAATVVTVVTVVVVVVVVGIVGVVVVVGVVGVVGVATIVRVGVTVSTPPTRGDRRRQRPLRQRGALQ